MEYLVTAPEILLSTAADVEKIGSAIVDANAGAAGPTAGLVAAAEDEVSEAIAKLFAGYGQQYHAVLAKAATFHDDFARALTGAGNAYAQAEARTAALLTGGTPSALNTLDHVHGDRVRESLGPTSGGLDHGRHLEPAPRSSSTWGTSTCRTSCRTSPGPIRWPN